MTADATRSRAPRRAARRGKQRSRGFRLVRTAALVTAVVLIASTGISIAPALMAPGTDSVAARLAEWGRDHGLGWAVTALEQAQYAKDKPSVGGSVGGGLPKTGPKTVPG